MTELKANSTIFYTEEVILLPPPLPLFRNWSAWGKVEEPAQCSETSPLLLPLLLPVIVLSSEKVIDDEMVPQPSTLTEIPTIPSTVPYYIMYFNYEKDEPNPLHPPVLHKTKNTHNFYATTFLLRGRNKSRLVPLQSVESVIYILIYQILILTILLPLMGEISLALYLSQGRNKSRLIPS